MVSARSLAAAGEGGGRAVLNFQDVTETARLKEQLRQSETMAEIGSIVAGVAHEVRNPLFSISATLDAFESRFRNIEGHERYLAVLRGEIVRLTGLMSDLLDFGRPSRPDFSACDVEEVIEAAVSACGPLGVLQDRGDRLAAPGGAPRGARALLGARLAGAAEPDRERRSLLARGRPGSRSAWAWRSRTASGSSSARSRTPVPASTRPTCHSTVRAVLHAPPGRHGPRAVHRQADRLRPRRRGERGEPRPGWGRRAVRLRAVAA